MQTRTSLWKHQLQFQCNNELHTLKERIDIFTLDEKLFTNNFFFSIMQFIFRTRKSILTNSEDNAKFKMDHKKLNMYLRLSLFLT